MDFSISIDSRLVPACLSEAGLSAASINEVRPLVAKMLSGQSPPRSSCPISVQSSPDKVCGNLTLEVLWDALNLRIETDVEAPMSAAFEKFSQTFDPAIVEAAKQITNRGLRELDAALLAGGASLESVRSAKQPITNDVAQILIEFQTNSIDRVIHEEIAGLMALPAVDNSVRATLGKFLIGLFHVPARRTHRFVLCQALVSLAEPELFEGLAALARDKSLASLRGRVCEALARSRHPDAAQTIAAVLEDGDDETKLCAIEALGELKALNYKEAIRNYLKYQSGDKDWSRAIQKAAGKTLKRL